MSRISPAWWSEPATGRGEAPIISRRAETSRYANCTTPSSGRCSINSYPEPEVRPLAPDDAPSILLDPSRTFNDFGAISFTPLEETVATAVAYYRQFGVKGGYTHLKLEKQDA